MTGNGGGACGGGSKCGDGGSGEEVGGQMGIWRW